MRRQLAMIAILLLCAASGAEAQGLAARVARLATGEVRMSFAARPGVCGDGRSFIGDATTPDGMRIYLYGDEGFLSGTSPDFRGECLPGPVRVSILKASGVTTDIRLFVGGAWRGAGQDLGTVAAADAADYLLDLARTAPERLSGIAILGATLADSVQLTAWLSTMGRDRTLRPYVRERALRWLPEVAEREGTLDAAERALRSVAADAADLAAVRQRAIRSLPASDANDTFLRELYQRLDVTALKDRVIRRLGETVSPENAAWLRARVLDTSDLLELRDRVIRVLGEDLGERDMLRDLYARMTETALRERIIRVVGDEGDESSTRWLQGVVDNPAEATGLRERALRMLGEGGRADYVRAVYPRLGELSLKDRAIRLAAESGDRESVAWLKRIVENGAEAIDLRDRAVRLLAERGEYPYLREAYGRVVDGSLKDRMIRSSAEAGGVENANWLRAIAGDDAESADRRDRAIRSLAESGIGTDELVRMYDSVKARVIRERLIRIFAERRDRAAIDKLIAVAKADPDESLRRFAVRRLAETGDPRAQEFLETTVRR